MAKDSPHKIILDRKKALGGRMVILGHHYQADEVIRYADFIGDSLELARKVSEIKQAQIIVFCGVLFMAQTAVILAPDKHVYIPDKHAGCPLADAAAIDDVLRAWEVIGELGRVIPITYVNSSAEIKAFCGRNGGAVCTSGNALKVLKWAFAQGERVFFLPDQNLGRNTARTLGLPDQEMAIWDPLNPPLPKALENARVILWHGWCPVHAPVMTVRGVEEARRHHENVKVIVHPEADPETVMASDAFGSTAQI
ncbi:MAG TPA: quinolinate synthase, partial [Deltaproteobacteria bacterium]|nr:quinolinate synthase [Deltaproteobacteria bacterium]